MMPEKVSEEGATRKRKTGDCECSDASAKASCECQPQKKSKTPEKADKPAKKLAPR
jgi:hypothetical protein